MLPRVAREYGHTWCSGAYQGLGDFPLQSRQADIETGRQTVNAMRYAEDHFRPANEGLLLHTHCLILYQK